MRKREDGVSRSVFSYLFPRVEAYSNFMDRRSVNICSESAVAPTTLATPIPLLTQLPTLVPPLPPLPLPMLVGVKTQEAGRISGWPFPESRADEGSTAV